MQTIKDRSPETGEQHGKCDQFSRNHRRRKSMMEKLK